MTAPTTFVFLGESGSLQEVGWDGPTREKLWRYNQHYFDDLNAVGADLRLQWHQSLIKDWIRNNPPGAGSGWDPYPTSLRIVNWVKWALAGNDVPRLVLESLSVQARWLRRRLEVHLLGNHLFANAKALVFAGLYFAGPEADQWLDAGLRLLRREVPEQVLNDGGHFERSTMYHAIALEDMLDLCNVVSAYKGALRPEHQSMIAEWRRRAASMLSWLHAMCHPDREISFFNDAAFGISASPLELQDYAERLAVVSGHPGSARSRWLQASGYARLSTRGAVALVDLAPVGPDYLPGHAHADTLSFELAIHGQRFWVNSGTSSYQSGAERQRQRGTAAHNTVSLRFADSSEVWSSFRVARRARVLSADVRILPTGVFASGAHDGYERLEQRAVHLRRWKMHDGRLTLEDRLSAKASDAVARFHFHPAVSVSLDIPSGVGRARLPGGEVVRWSVTRGASWIEASTWHPRFGDSVPNTCLCVRLVDGASEVTVEW